MNTTMPVTEACDSEFQDTLTIEAEAAGVAHDAPMCPTAPLTFLLGALSSVEGTR